MVCDIKSGQNPLSRGVGAIANPRKIIADAITSNSNNILSTRPQGRYMHGARCKIKINGRIAVFAFAVSWNIRTEQDEVWTIDEYTPYEYAPKRITVEGSIGSFRVPSKSPSKEQQQSNILSFLFHKYITIEVRDWQTDELLFYAPKAVITTRSEDFRAGELATMQLNWKAIGFQDEMKPDMPKSPDSGSTSSKKPDTSGGGSGGGSGSFNKPSLPLPNF